MNTRIILICLFLVVSVATRGQSSASTNRIHTNQALNIKRGVIKPEKNSPNKFLARLSETELIEWLWNEGYLEAYIDSIWMVDDQKQISLNPGRQFQWFSFSLNVDSVKGIEVPASTFMNRGNIFSLEEYRGYQESVSRVFSDRGYPFIKMRLDSVAIRDSLIEASMIILPGLRVQFDSLVSRSDQVVSQKVLRSISGIKKGDWYSASKILRAQKNLIASGLMADSEVVEVGFFDENAWLYVRPKKIKANRLSGIIGLAPFSSQGVPRLSGEFTIGLRNVIRQMEEFDLKWRAPGNGTQKLVSSFGIPYLFGSPIGVSAELELYKRDTSYLNIGAKLGGRYNFAPGSWMDLLYETRRSNRLAAGAQSDIQEFELNMTKLRFQWDKRDHRIYPKSGWFMLQEIGYGLKNVPDQDGSDYLSDYYELSLISEVYIPVYQSWSVFLGFQGGYRSGELSENEQFRIGGSSLLRGFQEEQFYTGAYTLGTIELRYSFAEVSNFHIFMDGGWMSSAMFPYSPGIGLSLDTRAGLLSLDYSFGQLASEGFSLQNGLVHLGIQSIF